MNARPPSRRFTPSKVTQWLIPALLVILTISLLAVIVIVAFASVSGVH